jgi:hypothetical protein
LLSTLVVGLLLATGSRLHAQEGTKPVVVVSVSSYDELLKDIEYIGQLRNQPELAKTLEGLLGFFTQGQGLNGLDKSRPWGMAVLTDGATFPKALFLPVSDVDKLLAALMAFVGQPKDAGDGVLEITLQQNNMPLFIKNQEGWAWISQSADELAALPKNPLELLGGMEKQYDLAVRANVQNVPEIYRQLAVDALTDGFEKNLQKEEGEDDASFEKRKQFARSQLENMVTVINELDQLTIGWSIDRTAKKTHFDFGMTAKPDSKTASQMARIKDFKTRLSGFIQPAGVLSLSAASSYTDEEAAQAQQTLDSARETVLNDIENSDDIEDEQTRKQLASIVSDGMDILKAMLKGGRSDAAASVTGSGPYVASGALFVGDTARVAPLVDKIVELLKSRERLVSFDKKVSQTAGVSFDKITLKPREGEQGEKIAKLLGEGNIEILVGTDKDTVYVAAGSGALPALEQGIQTSKTAGETPATPLNFTASTAAIAQLVSLVDDDNLQAGAMAAMLKEGGNDKIRVQYQPVTNGVIVRLEAEEGVIKLMGMLAPQRAQPPGF